MNNYFLKTIIFAMSTLFFISCTGNQIDSNKLISIKKSKITDIEFDSIVANFEYLSLPFKGELESRNFIKFFNFNHSDNKAVSKIKIPNEIAIKYFYFPSDTANIKNAKCEFYYGYNLPVNGKYVLLFYYRFSTLKSFEYRIASFDYNGKLIDDLGLGGGINTHGSLDIDVQREFMINDDFQIDIEEIIIDNDAKTIDSNDLEIYIVQRKNISYKINTNGKFEKSNEQYLGNLEYFYDEYKNKLISKYENSIFRK